MSYLKYALKTKKKLAAKGFEITFNRKSEEVYDPETDSYSTQDVSITGFALQLATKFSQVDGKSILAGDVFLMVYLDDKPKMNDTFSFGGRDYTVVNVKPFMPDNKTAIYYTVQGR